MESTMVIKAKHEETLRRFNARIVNLELDLNLDGLREKIISLFKFTPDTELMLTYVDEDGDIVMLGDDEDLRDVVRQALNPLRITVKLSIARTSGISTPLRSPQMQQPSQNLGSNVLLKSVPEPIRKIITKICTDLAYTGSPSGQTLTDLVQCFSEMGLPYLNQLSDLLAGANNSKQDGPSGCTTNIPASSQEAEGSKGDAAASDVLPSAGSKTPSSRSKEVFQNTKLKRSDPKNKEESSVNGSGGAKALVRQFPGLEDLKVALDYANPKPPRTIETDASKKKEIDYQSDEQLPIWKAVHISPVSVPVPNTVTGDNKEASDKPKESMGTKSISAHAFPSYPANAIWCKPSSQMVRDTIGYSSGSNVIPLSECPFTGLPLGNSTAVAPQLPSHVVHPRRKHGLSDNSGIAFHFGVRCDGCGVHPITGPRFKSKVKDDYDLCSICFAQMGNESDYIRMDRPVACRHPYSYKGSYGLYNRVQTPPQPPVFRCGGVKPGRPKLDSRFIQDVNILDGTLMAPSTRFTKIWRMRNNGSVVWPQGTQLVWTGGDKLSDIFSVAIEIASAGLPVNQELDIAVDFVAPDRPGRYISYWRMASPSGQNFGQRVWVLIQVDASSKELPHEGFRGFNLNLPPVSNGISGPEIISVNPVPAMVDNLPGFNNSNGGIQLVEPVVAASQEREQEANFPINDTLLVGGGGAISSPVPAAPASLGSYPIIDLVGSGGGAISSPVPAAPASLGSYPIIDLVGSGGGAISNPVLAAPASLGSYPIIDLSEVAPPESCLLQATVVKTSAQDVKEKASSQDVNEKAAKVDENLLKYVEEQSELEENLHLEEMGFKHVDLNKEILRSNEYDLEKSVDELCGVPAGWDLILEELREMGFCDKATNHKLLKKNNGSIKRVVMDLLVGEQ